MVHWMVVFKQILMLDFIRGRGIRVKYVRDKRVDRVCEDVIRRLKQRVSLEEVSGAGQYDVKVMFCPIVSRAGTDIEAVLWNVTAGEATILIVLHHTIDRHAILPSSSSYDRDGLKLVDFLFSENAGLLDCERNTEAFNKAESHLTQWLPLYLNLEAPPASQSPPDTQRPQGNGGHCPKKHWVGLTVMYLVLLWKTRDYYQRSPHAAVGVVSGMIGGIAGGFFNRRGNGWFRDGLVAGAVGGSVATLLLIFYKV